ncbi:nitroreductase/quinone reductase family protein [Halopiger thermotolerans]
MSHAVLVTAASGTVGRHVVEHLLERDAVVKAGSRNPAGAGEQFARREDLTALDGERGGGADDSFVEFDFERPETWGPALDGVDAVFLVRPPGVAEDDLTAFVDAAVRVGADRIVYLSTLGADRNVLLPHHRIERHVAASGATYTFLRASFFMQNLHEVHGRDVLERDEIFVPAGAGATSFVDARDVGEIAARVLAQPDDHRDVAYDVTGPDALTYDEVAAAFSSELDREITYAAPSIPAFVARMRDRGHPIGYVLLIVGIYTTARLGFADRVTDDAARLLERRPRGIEEYVAGYADEFRRDDAAGTERGAADSSRVRPASPPPDWLVRVVNPILERVLRSPIHGLVSDDLLLLTVTGRTTGTDYTFPVGYERSGDVVYVTSHGTNWWKNLRNGGQRVSLRLEGRERTGHAEVFERNDVVAEYLQEYFRRRGLGADRRVGLEVRGEAVPGVDTLQEAVDHVVLVRIDLRES